jgi:chemotaxis protein MotB
MRYATSTGGGGRRIRRSRVVVNASNSAALATIQTRWRSPPRLFGGRGMLGSMTERNDPSGIDVYPKLPIPKSRQSEPKVTGLKGGGGGGKAWKIAAGVVVAIAVGGGAGYVLAPTKADQLAASQKALGEAKTASRIEADRADAAKKQVEVLSKDKKDLEEKYAAASSRLAENEKKEADANAAAQKRLQQAVDTGTGEVSTEGEEIHLKLVDKVLFAVGDDQLTGTGKAVLAKVGRALADLPDKQVWVQGHTDDQPIILPPAPPPPKKKTGKAAKGAKPVEPPPGVRFVSNWELSAARALQVVHYLQDVAKIEPSRLAALAFGQYRPVSKSNKALNRRIEIVLYPHRAVIERAKKK